MNNNEENYSDFSNFMNEALSKAQERQFSTNVYALDKLLVEYEYIYTNLRKQLYSDVAEAYLSIEARNMLMTATNELIKVVHKV